tara:strand:- start:89 stop:238 length:150 start_codon:yes stop_codon:yes gene_type:complete
MWTLEIVELPNLLVLIVPEDILLASKEVKLAPDPLKPVQDKTPEVALKV